MTAITKCLASKKKKYMAYKLCHNAEVYSPTCGLIELPVVSQYIVVELFSYQKENGVLIKKCRDL